jgi:eukaryotic-like serine/threonine-protein kinase
LIKKALIVGIDKYEHMPTLNGCVNDANEMERVLSSESCEFRVVSLINEQATRAEFRSRVKWALSEADFSIIYFAGHGIKTDFSAHLVCWDGDDQDGVEVDSIQKAIVSLSNEHQTVILILDCCHSGASPMTGLTGATPLSMQDLPIVRGRGRVLLAACTSDQNANETTDDSGSPRGKFSYHLIRAIEGYASNEENVVTLSAVYDYVAQQFKNETAQAPIFRGDQEGTIDLATGVKLLGSWKQPSDDFLDPVTAIGRGEAFLNRVRIAIQDVASHSDWLQRGYRQACAAYEPVRKWFLRVLEGQPALRKEAKFLELHNNLLQLGQQLGTVHIGTLLPWGTVSRSLGGGTFGTVFLIATADTDSNLCLKVFHANDLHQSEKVARFRRGYDAMRQMDHPNIVKVREFSEVPLGFYMEYVPGANARDYAPGIVGEPAEIVRLLLQVAETLQHAHGRQVIHRDVKPENILIKISEAGQADAYLTDFDLAWFDTATKLTKLADGFGSHFYAAPEQMAKPNSPSARSELVDVFSFGQLMFYFITGRDPIPMDGHGNSIAFGSALSQYWTDPAQANALQGFYNAATDVDPKKRPTSFRDICQMLAAVELELVTPLSEYELGQFLRRLRFTLTGDFGELDAPAAVTMRSRSGVTEISVYPATENSGKLALDVSFRPDSLLIEGLGSREARQVVNQRIDSALQGLSHKSALRKSGGAGGGFETNVRIENLKKNAEGVLMAREVISKVIDTIERAGG